MEFLNLQPIVKVHVILLYWLAVACLLAFLTSRKVRKTYDEPLQNLANAAKKVAEGDFSIYVPTVHSTGNYDYLDLMIQNFNKMVEELGSIETLKTDFFANVSHEFKTPLAIISNNAQLLETLPENSKTREECVSNIMDATRRLSNLITNILKLNKLEKGHSMQLDEEQHFDVCNQLTCCILQFEGLLDKKHIDLQVNIQDRCIVKADEELMQLVWTNLVSNAIKFTDDFGTIAISQRAEDEVAVISISDSGCGMTKEEQKHVFDKFYQADSARATQGNGLGLTLIKRILELMDAAIHLESEVGRGTTFTVKVPLKKSNISTIGANNTNGSHKD